jgi:hypothetical protein
MWIKKWENKNLPESLIILKFNKHFWLVLKRYENQSMLEQNHQQKKRYWATTRCRHVFTSVRKLLVNKLFKTIVSVLRTPRKRCLSFLRNASTLNELCVCLCEYNGTALRLQGIMSWWCPRNFRLLGPSIYYTLDVRRIIDHYWSVRYCRSATNSWAYHCCVSIVVLY